MKSTNADRLTSTESDVQVIKPPAGVAQPQGPSIKKGHYNYQEANSLVNRRLHNSTK